MKQRLLSCLLILALLLPVGAAFAASTMGDVHVTAHHGQTVTLTAAAFTDELTVDPAESGVTLADIAFPALPAATEAVILLDGSAYTADTPVPLARITAGDLRIRVEAAVAATVRIPFRATLSNGDTLDADLIVTVTPEALSASHTVIVGESVRITLRVREWTPEARYTIAFQGDRNLQHGTLSPVAGEPGVFLFHATSEGMDSFTFTVTRDGITSAPGTITITVEPSPYLPFVKYYDMPTHWASYAAGRLATLEKIIGHRVDSRFFFHPDRGITRGDFLIWLCSVAGIEPTANANVIYADPDIPSWMRGFLHAATEEGVIQGAPASSAASTNYFLPNNPVTRIEAIRMISIALGPEGHDDDLTDLFHDIASIPGWARNNVKHLAELEIITGDTNGYLHPMRNLSRAEAAEMLYKMYKEMHLPHNGGPTI
ncbi:MAG: S-layer homology domain-containing protein [Oscillospiraceae bacterium]|nr:S-layer homology domain-containing protein [Oscillospiraceae bacterium]